MFFDGEKITRKNMDETRRRMGMVFQSFGLFSHLDVMGNLTAGPVRLLHMPEKEAGEQALRLLKTVGFVEHALGFYRAGFRVVRNSARRLRGALPCRRRNW